MRTRILFAALAFTCALAILLVAQSPNTRGDEQPAPKFGLDKRVPWTTSHVQGSPQPPSPYRTEFAFPKLPIFDEPLDITNAPGSDRLFVTERYGKIFSIRNDPKVTKADLLLDMNQVLQSCCRLVANDQICDDQGTSLKLEERSSRGAFHR